MAKSVVSIVRNKDASYAVKKSIELVGGLEDKIEKNARVLLKPNLVYGVTYETGTTTNPAVLRTLVELIRPITKDIALIESNFGIVPIPESPMPIYKEVGKVFKLPEFEAMKKLGVRLVDLTKEKKRSFSLTPNKILDSVEIPVDLYDGATLVNAAVLKSHGITTVTLGIKNLYGLIPTPPIRNRLHGTISTVLSDLAELFSSIFTVIDGSVGMEGPSSCFGAPVGSDLMIASDNVVAADSVGTRVMGYNPENIGHIAEAAKRGLGNLDDIEVKGETIEKVKKKFNMDMQLPHNIVRKVKDLGTAKEEDLLPLYPSDNDLVRRYLKTFVMYGPLVRDGETYRFETKLFKNFICRKCVQTGHSFCAGWKQI
jgi:uncharacterized protein (DUF362 family)